MTRVESANSRCRAGVASCDITPPVGIYHRMWGAALHDRATGVHRPLEAKLIWLEGDSADASTAQLIISLDHCILDAAEIQNIQGAIHDRTGIMNENILITLTHTHGSGWMSRSRSHFPGGELLGPYLDKLAGQLADAASEAKSRLVPATIVYGIGRCNLAAHRDYLDKELGRFVCGFNPSGIADDTLTIARIKDDSQKTLATVVNYACHPTTLAWDNTLISPDWVGAMREVIEQTEGGICLYLQGASGDLGPREGFVGNTEIADRNGRQVAYSALSTMATMPPPGTEFGYTGAVVSGTLIGTWDHVPVNEQRRKEQARWNWEELIVDLPYRHDLPTLEETIQQKEHWEKEENKARGEGDDKRIRDCRAEVEQRTRQITRLQCLVPGRTYPLKLKIGMIGNAIWIFTPGELYQLFQTTIRTRFAPHPVIICTLTNDWQPGYIPTAQTYGYQIYQEVIAATAAGCLELLIEAVSRKVSAMLLDIQQKNE